MAKWLKCEGMSVNGTGCGIWIFGDTTLQDVAERAKRAGLDGVELLGDVENIDAKMAKTVFADHGLDILSITPGDDADISHPDATVRGQALDYFAGLMDFAAD